MDKNERKLIWEKTDGKCYYCGKNLNIKWHVDHIEPVMRSPYTKEMHKPQNDNFENKVPSCPRCNRWKHSQSLEGFRFDIQNLITRLNRDFSQYRMAKDFGLITETEKEVVFHFENKESGYVSILTDNEKRYIKKALMYGIDFSGNHNERQALKNAITKLRL